MTGIGSPSRPAKPGGKTTRAPSDSSSRPSASRSSTTPRKQRVVEALADDVGRRQEHAEPVVDGLELARGLVDEQLPERERLGVAGLQPYDALAAARLELLARVEDGARLAVELGEVAGAELAHACGAADVDQVLDQHPERRAPVADVVLADHLVAREGQEPHDRVADHGRAQVPDVHLLGDVRRRVVHDHALGRRRGRHAEPVADGHRSHLRGEEGVAEREVDEPGPGDLDERADVGQIVLGDDGLGDLAWRPSEASSRGRALRWPGDRSDRTGGRRDRCPAPRHRTWRRGGR